MEYPRYAALYFLCRYIKFQCNIFVIQSLSQQSINRAQDACLFPTAAHFMPRRYVAHGARESRHLRLWRPKRTLSLSTIMIATTSNSWSELLTLCCVLTLPVSPGPTAAPCICPLNEHFCTELREFLCHLDFVVFRKTAD